MADADMAQHIAVTLWYTGIDLDTESGSNDEHYRCWASRNRQPSLSTLRVTRIERLRRWVDEDPFWNSSSPVSNDTSSAESSVAVSSESSSPPEPNSPVSNVTAISNDNSSPPPRTLRANVPDFIPATAVSRDSTSPESHDTGSSSARNSRGSPPLCSTLYVDNIATGTHEQVEGALRSLFESRAGFRRLRLDLRVHWMCFVEFASVDFAREVRDALDGYNLFGGSGRFGLRVEYARNSLNRRYNADVVRGFQRDG